jgi:hypothetical protein
VSIQAEKYSLLGFVYQVFNFGFWEMNDFRGALLSVIPAHQAFIIPYDKNTTLPLGPLLFEPFTVFA